MYRSYTRSQNNQRGGYDISPLNLQKWFANALLMAEDLKGEFMNIYTALKRDIPLSLSEQTQEELLSDSPVEPSPSGIYPRPATHFDEHRQLRWAIRMLGHGTTTHWCEPATLIHNLTSSVFVIHNEATTTSQDPAGTYIIVFNHDAVIDLQKDDGLLFPIDIHPSIIRVVNETSHAHVIRWRTTEDKRTVGTAPPSTCVNYWWDGTTVGHPTELYGWSYPITAPLSK